MTYKKRQEVLRAAADWMDVCEKAGVAMRFKLEGRIETESIFCPDYRSDPSLYEFPLALLEGKEVWAGSELYYEDGVKWRAANKNQIFDGSSWNPPKPKTVMVELPCDFVETHAAPQPGGSNE